MGTNQGKPLISFKTRKDQVVAVFNLSVLSAVIVGVVRCVGVIWKVFTIAGSYATVDQITNADKATRTYCDTIVAEEKQSRKEADEDFKIDMRDLRRKCLRGWGDK